ncbi:MAG TPA: RNA polymerase sigma-70 factor [Gemmatimonadales bacterium]|nr:RNA polymerase sigma-70 factor [Gemmatimonadales bacterium]
MDADEPDTGGTADEARVDRGSRDGMAFRELFHHHFAPLYRFVYRYVHSAETAKDLVHEAFLLLWRQRAQVSLDSTSAKSYLFTIARYRALDYLRRRRREEQWQRRYADPIMADGEPALATDPYQELAASETAAAIRHAVDTLPRRQREVLLLRWQRQASYDEIAETLGISPKTVAIHVGRAIQRLRELLAQTR